MTMFTGSERGIERSQIRVAAAKFVGVIVVGAVLAAFALVTAVELSQWVLRS